MNDEISSTETISYYAPGETPRGPFGAGDFYHETLLAIALQLSTGSRFGFARASTAICSGFVADALTRAGYIFERPPSFTMPADLAKLFSVTYPYK